MKDCIEQRIYYADTDSYGVAWHGSYVRWMEMGRTEFCRRVGLSLSELGKKNIIFPVINMNIRYKSPAKLDDEIIIETELSEIKPVTIIFKQVIKNKHTNHINAIAYVEIASTTSEGKLYRNIPDVVSEIFERSKSCKG